MDIPRHVAEIGRDVSLGQGAVNLLLFMIHLVRHPDTVRYGDFIPYWRRFYDGAQFFGAGVDEILDVS